MTGEWLTPVVPGRVLFRPKAHLWGPDPERTGWLRSRCGGVSVPPSWTRTGCLCDRQCRTCRRIERIQPSEETPMSDTPPADLSDADLHRRINHLRTELWAGAPDGSRLIRDALDVLQAESNRRLRGDRAGTPVQPDRRRRGVTIRQDGTRGATVEVDGTTLADLAGAVVEIRPDDVPRVTLDLASVRTAVGLDAAVVEIRPATAEVLRQLGWTSPVESSAMLSAAKRRGERVAELEAALAEALAGWKRELLDPSCPDVRRARLAEAGALRARALR